MLLKEGHSWQVCQLFPTSEGQQVLQEWQAMLSVFCLTSQRKLLAVGGRELGDLRVWWGPAVI